VVRGISVLIERLLVQIPVWPFGVVFVA